MTFIQNLYKISRLKIYILLIILLIGIFFSNVLIAKSIKDDRPITESEQGVVVWLETSLKRIFPKSPAGSKDLTLLAARNSTIAFQVGFRNSGTKVINAACSLKEADNFDPTVRFVGLVPMHLTPGTDPDELTGTEYLPGLVPDPLMPASQGKAGPLESRSFWITLHIPSSIKPGEHVFKVRLTYAKGQKEVVLPVKLKISSLIIQPRHDFHVTHWWRGEATWDYYKTGMFDKRWWKLTKAQLEDMLNHGSDVIYVPVFFDRRETFKRPCQLLIVNEPDSGNYTMDWSRVKKFVDMAKKVGFKKFEWSHLWIYWGLKNPMRIYTKKKGKYKLLWSPNIGAFSDTYVSFLKQFLPEFHQFLFKQNILKDSYFHVSDEPHSNDIKQYKKARQLLQSLAPWMDGKIMDALSDINYGKQGLADIPVVMVNSAQAYIDAKIPHWVYYCNIPRGPYLNRYMDTPLAKIRMSGWLFYHFKEIGFLHWGYNYWHQLGHEKIVDPFANGDAGAYPVIPYGDPFEVYPGKNKPIDSIRWEVFAESLQDYAILQTAGVDPDAKMLSDIKSYANFPKNGEWIKNKLKKLLSN